VWHTCRFSRTGTTEEQFWSNKCQVLQHSGNFSVVSANISFSRSNFSTNSVLLLLLFYYYVLVTGLFFLVILLNQQWSPPLRLQASHCRTFRIMCDVPSIAVFCSESIECFPGTASKCFLKLLVTIPVGSNYYWYNRTFEVLHTFYLYT
jgi:hypothetical protein